MMQLHTLSPYEYKRFIPDELHSEADRLVGWLTNFPFTPPEKCPKCGQIDLEKRTDIGIPGYRCRKCRKEFRRTTGTPLIRFRKPHLWGIAVQHMLYGSPKHTTVQQLGVTDHTLSNWYKIFETIMENDYSSLYSWYISNKSYLQQSDIFIPIQIQINAFRAWLQGYLHPKCPNCFQNNVSIYRKLNFSAKFYCHDCLQDFRINRSRGIQVGHHHLLPDIFEAMVRGKDLFTLSKKMNINAITMMKSRKRMMQKIEDLGYQQLFEWLQWRNRCRTALMIREGRAKNKKNS